MAQELIQTQSMQQVQTLTPQQLQVVKLLELPVAQLAERVKNEVMDNPALETGFTSDGEENENNQEGDAQSLETDSTNLNSNNDGNINSVLYDTDDDTPDYNLRGSRENSESFRPEQGDDETFYSQLMEQMDMCNLTPHEHELMEYLIGSLDGDGLLRKSLKALVDELEIYQGMDTSEQELEQVLKKLQQFEPAGIGARSLQECLLIQLRRLPNAHSEHNVLMQNILTNHFDEFVNKRWNKLQKRFNLTEADMRSILQDLRHLNPRPGSALGEGVNEGAQRITPDFIVETLEDGELNVSLNNGDVPLLHLSQAYNLAMKEYEHNKERMTRQEKQNMLYIKQKVDSAQGFISAIKERQHTLILTIRAIVKRQHDFFMEGDASLLHPMILKDVAEDTGLDISTISRVSNSKYVQTDFGIFPLKFFFNDRYITEEGEELSTQKIKQALKELIDNENSSEPLSDETLAAMLKEKGYPIARRTVAKYREQLKIPIARLRR